MTKLGTFFLELLRMCVLLMITLLVLGGLERWIYQLIYGYPIYNWSMGLGNLLLSFVMYRNYFQFYGWYKSEKNKKLSAITTRNVTILALVLIMIPIWVH